MVSVRLVSFYMGMGDSRARDLDESQQDSLHSYEDKWVAALKGVLTQRGLGN